MEYESESSGEAGPAPGVAAPGTRLAAFRALRHRNFKLFFFGQFVSLTGVWMQSVAVAWLVLKLTNSALWLGVVAFAGQLPILIAALLAGVVVDHVDRRRMIMGTQSLLMLSAFVLGAITVTGVVRVEYVIIIAAFNGLVSSFDMPGRQAFIVEMVGREDLPNAIALNSVIFNSARAIGPALAGVLIVLIGIGGCFFINGVTYLAVIWSLSQMRLPRREITQFGHVILQRVREGVSYVRRHRPSFYLLMLVAINSGFAMTYVVLIPVFAKDILHAGARGYGFLMAAWGVGAVIGAMAMASRNSEGRSLRQSLTAGIFVTAGAILCFGLSHWLVLSLVAQMFVGAGLMNYMAATNTMLQLFVSDELRGRLMSIYTLSFIGLAPLGSLEVGFVGDHLGPEIAAVICAVVSLACACFLLTRLKLFAQAQDAMEAAALDQAHHALST